jgi:exodeoxyribonuclease VII large subunit
VQGDHAGPDIARAIRFINQHHERALREGRHSDLVDVLIVGRGGGSTEDLWAFNQEEVARAIRASKIPVISAVGHETDFTIADFVADHRAPTPSAAAEIVAAHEDQLCTSLEQLGRQLLRLTRYRIVEARSQVQEHALSRVFDEVKSRLRDARVGTNLQVHQLEVLMNQSLQRAQSRTNYVLHKLSPSRLEMRSATLRARLEAASTGCDNAIDAKLQRSRERLVVLAASLDALSPLAVLQRGYAIAQDAAGKLVRDAHQVPVGDELRVRLAKGRLITRVESRHE